VAGRQRRSQGSTGAGLAALGALWAGFAGCLRSPASILWAGILYSETDGRHIDYRQRMGRRARRAVDYLPQTSWEGRKVDGMGVPRSSGLSFIKPSDLTMILNLGRVFGFAISYFLTLVGASTTGIGIGLHRVACVRCASAMTFIITPWPQSPKLAFRHQRIMRVLARV
jgi:hypothetical protein